MSSSSSKRPSSPASPPPAKKRRLHEQKCRSEYFEEFPVFTRSRLGDSYAFCTLCRADIKITSGGKNDLERHVQTTKHKSYAVSAGTSSKISSFFCSEKKNNDLAVIRAETIFTDFIVQNNLPVAVSDKAAAMFRQMFPDSAIAKKYACARTKTTAVINKLATEEAKIIAAELQQQPFSIATDGSSL